MADGATSLWRSPAGPTKRKRLPHRCSIQASSHLTSSVAADARTSGTGSRDAISVPLRRRPPRPSLRGPVRGGRNLALKQHLGTFAEAAARAFDSGAAATEPTAVVSRAVCGD